MTVWLLIIGAILIWYVVVTGIVAYRGAFDIKNMISDLKKRKNGKKI